MKFFYGRRSSKKLNKIELDSLFKSEFYLNKYNCKKKLYKFTDNYHLCNLEIGFGSGENLLRQAYFLKNQGFIGCDPFLNGNLKVLKSVNQDSLRNIMITNLDFKSLFLTIVNAFKFYKIFILFPDPWPKRRHNKRRLINFEFLEDLKKILMINGRVIISTDHSEYFEEILAKFSLKNFFKREYFSEKNNPNLNQFQQLGLFSTKYFDKAKNKSKTTNCASFKLVQY